MYDKFKRFLEDDSFFYGVLIVLIAVASFGLGRLSMTSQTMVSGQNASVVLKNEPISAKTASTAPETNAPAEEAKETYVASKSGTKFHLLWCPGASQIKEENKIYFATKEEALASGYTPAANCKGI